MTAQATVTGEEPKKEDPSAAPNGPRFTVAPETLKELVALVSALAEEAVFVFSKKGLKVVVTDTSHVALATLSLPAKGFAAYECGKDAELGLDVTRLKDVLALADPDDRIEWAPAPDGKRVVLKFGNLVRRMAPIDAAAMDRPRPPNLTLPAEATVDLEEFRKGIKAAGFVTDHVALVIRPEGFHLEGEGDTERVDLDVAKGDERLKSVKAEEPVPEGGYRSCYPLDYLSLLAKAIPRSPVTLRMGQEYPLRIEFEFAEGVGEGSYLLAPRIEE